MNKLLCAGLLILTLELLPLAARADTINDIWIGKSGANWSSAANWNTGAVPNNNAFTNYNVTIQGGASGLSSQQDLQSDIINSLTLLNANVFITPGRNLTINGDLTGAGDVQTLGVFDSSTLTIGGALSSTVSVAADLAGGLTLLNASNITDAGVVSMGTSEESNGTTVLSSIGGNSALLNAGIIQGTGFLQSISNLTNNGGTITAGGNASAANTLFIQAGRFDNTNGILAATAGYTASVQSPNFVNLQGTTLTGGLYNIAGTLALNGNINAIGLNTVINLSGSGEIKVGNSNALAGLGLNQGVLGVVGGGFQVFGGPNLANAGTIDVIENSTGVTAGAVLNSGTLFVESGSTFRAAGGFNSGSLDAEGTIDLRSGAIDSFSNLSAADETLRGGSYTVGPNGTLIYSAGSGAHGGAIVDIGSDASVNLNGGQIQYGNGFNALADLTGNAGDLTIGQGNYSFTPVGGTFSNTGTLDVASSSSFITVAGSGRNSGTLSILGGEATFNNTYTQTGGKTDLEHDGILNAGATNIEAGTLDGNGVVFGNIDNSGGTVNPDQGTIEDVGDYTQEAGGTLSELLGSDSYLIDDQDVTLSGIFEATLETGLVPEAGDVYEVLHYTGSLTGNFSTLDLPTLAGGLEFQEVIGPHDITLDVVQGTATPEPAYFWLTGALLTAVGLKRRKK